MLVLGHTTGGRQQPPPHRLDPSVASPVPRFWVSGSALGLDFFGFRWLILCLGRGAVLPAGYLGWMVHGADMLVVFPFGGGKGVWLVPTASS